MLGDVVDLRLHPNQLTDSGSLQCQSYTMWHTGAAWVSKPGTACVYGSSLISLSSSALASDRLAMVVWMRVGMSPWPILLEFMQSSVVRTYIK